MTMLYLMAMRLFSPRQGRGLNVYLYLPDAPPNPHDVWSLADNPGPPREDFPWREVTDSSGSSVEAFLDLIIHDRSAYSAKLIEGALNQIERQVEEGSPNPSKFELQVGETVVYAAFSVNLGLADLPIKLRVLGELRRSIERWGGAYEAKLKGLSEGTGARRAVG
jgi:hypothetical protein